MEKKFTTKMFPLKARVILWWDNLKSWYFLKFKATERQKCNQDLLTYGTAIMKGDKRVDLLKFFAQREMDNK